MSNLVDHARRELARIDVDSDDDMQEQMNEHIIEMVQLFADAGHSGFSAAYAIGTLEKLLQFEPLQPLTGESDEWQQVTDDLFQNKRCSHVFSETGTPDGSAHDIQGKVFVDPDGMCYTNSESIVPVTFPYTPSIEYVHR